MLKKVTLTYHAPPGDAKMVEAYGQNLVDGEAKECLVPEAELAKLKNNRYFEVGKEQDAPAPKQTDDATAKAAEEADKAKLEAQGPNPPQRGAILNKPQEEAEGEASATHKSQADKAHATHQAAGKKAE